MDDLTRILVPGSMDALSSMTLDQAEDERLCLPSFKTRMSLSTCCGVLDPSFLSLLELLGFDGLIIETYLGLILTLTLF